MHLFYFIVILKMRSIYLGSRFGVLWDQIPNISF